MPGGISTLVAVGGTSTKGGTPPSPTAAAVSARPWGAIGSPSAPTGGCSSTGLALSRRWGVQYCSTAAWPTVIVADSAPEETAPAEDMVVCACTGSGATTRTHRTT